MFLLFLILWFLGKMAPLGIKNETIIYKAWLANKSISNNELRLIVLKSFNITKKTLKKTVQKFKDGGKPEKAKTFLGEFNRRMKLENRQGKFIN